MKKKRCSLLKHKAWQQRYKASLGKAYELLRHNFTPNELMLPALPIPAIEDVIHTAHRVIYNAENPKCNTNQE